MNKYKTIIIVTVLFIILLGIGYMIKNITTNKNTIERPEINTQNIEEAKKITTINDLPWIEEINKPEQGIDTESAVVKLSQQSINGLESKLPFTKTVTSPDGIEVEVVIPPTEILSNDWTLLIHIFGPDYQIPEDDPSVESEKRAFLLGVSEAVSFLKSQGVNTDEIIINWGDQAIVRDRSNLWLKKR